MVVKVMKKASFIQKFNVFLLLKRRTMSNIQEKGFTLFWNYYRSNFLPQKKYKTSEDCLHST